MVYRFDPLGLSAPKNYLQYDLDSLDLNKAVNAPGKLVGAIKEESGAATATSLQPYKDAFGLQRFRENELIHGRCESDILMCIPVPRMSFLCHH